MARDFTLVSGGFNSSGVPDQSGQYKFAQGELVSDLASCPSWISLPDFPYASLDEAREITKARGLPGFFWSSLSPRPYEIGS